MGRGGIVPSAKGSGIVKGEKEEKLRCETQKEEAAMRPLTDGRVPDAVCGQAGRGRGRAGLAAPPARPEGPRPGRLRPAERGGESRQDRAGQGDGRRGASLCALLGSSVRERRGAPAAGPAEGSRQASALVRGVAAHGIRDRPGQAAWQLRVAS